MNRGVFCLSVVAVGLTVTQVTAQENDPTAYSIAVRQDACNGRGIEKAYFVEPKRVAVECEADAGAVAVVGSGGTGTATAGGVIALGSLALLGAFASGQAGGSGSTGSTNSTTGTN